MSEKAKQTIHVSTRYLMLFGFMPILRITRTIYINQENNRVIHTIFWLFSVIPVCGIEREYVEHTKQHA